MFPHRFRGSLVTILALGLLAVALAQVSSAAPLVKAEGRIISIDRYGVTVDEGQPDAPRSFAVNSSTKIMRDGNLARLMDLRPADAVRITVRPLGDKLIALTITAISPPPGTPQ
jgi:hypothetical protein